VQFSRASTIPEKEISSDKSEFSAKIFNNLLWGLCIAITKIMPLCQIVPIPTMTDYFWHAKNLYALLGDGWGIASCSPSLQNPTSAVAEAINCRYLRWADASIKSRRCHKHLTTTVGERLPQKLPVNAGRQRQRDGVRL